MLSLLVRSPGAFDIILEIILKLLASCLQFAPFTAYITGVVQRVSVVPPSFPCSLSLSLDPLDERIYICVGAVKYVFPSKLLGVGRCTCVAAPAADKDLAIVQ